MAVGTKQDTVTGVEEKAPAQLPGRMAEMTEAAFSIAWKGERSSSFPLLYS
jgi:hypothetical protein